MFGKKIYWLLIAFGITSCKEQTLFKKIEAEDSGITFSNRITENDTLNILDFEYVYNGSGVGIADFNNDGFQDIFFSGNQVPCKLYLNKKGLGGETLRFEDITEKAGIDNKGKWCSGVTTVDINADGWMDVYVSATVKGKEKERENLLFVNQGIQNGTPVFKEMAAEYGVADSGNTENATFFDYDNDGDLDLYVLTNVIDLYPNQYRAKKTDGTHPNTDRFYRCDWDEKLGHSVYTNVSKEAGITIEGHGLGINVFDINRDGWKDIYVTNDYLTDDLLYINNHDGTFKESARKYFKHTSQSAMGNDVGDINNDGYQDIIAMDMLAKNNYRKKVLTGPNSYQMYLNNLSYDISFQFLRNTLQLNNGIDSKNSPMFSEISFLGGMAETDWSWTPSMADFDNDGYKDIIITNGFPKDVTDRDFAAFRQESERLAERSFILEQIPVVKISNYAYKNKGNLDFENVTEKWGLDQPSFSNGAVYADLDNDGDLDYVINNINDSAFVYQNNLEMIDKEKQTHFLRLKFEGDKLNKNGYGTVAELTFEDGEKVTAENNPSRGYLSSVEPLLHFGIGKKKVKTLKVSWYNGYSQIIENPMIDKVLTLKIQEAKQPTVWTTANENLYFNDVTDSLGIRLVHTEFDFIDYNYQNLLPFKLSELGPGMAVGDINGDGLEDVYMGGSRNKSGLFLVQNASGKFATKYLMDTTKLNMKEGEDLGSLFFDADGDGDLDLYICRGGTEGQKGSEAYQDELYINNGTGNFEKSAIALPKFFESTSCVRAADFDKDGDLDLLVAGRNVPYEYPKFTSSKILRNDSSKGLPKFSDITKTIAPELENGGLVCDVLWTDYDNDGWIDLIVAPEWSEIKVFKNNKGKLQQLKNTGLENFKGLWTSINGADFDMDGDIDYIVGNIGENNLMRGTEKEPVKVLAKDFDKNGVYDLFPFVYFTNENNERVLVPFNGKDDVNKQLNSTRQKWVTYKEFAAATYDNMFTIAEKEGAQELTLNCNSSVYIENKGGGNFALRPLPRLAQISSVLGILIEDFDQDGYLDALLSGNNYGNELTSGRLDASNGLFLKGDGKGNFQASNRSGFYVPFDAKSTVSLTDARGNLLVFAAQNRGPLKVFKSHLTKTNLPIPANACSVVYEVNGKKTKRELYWGSGYLGQSSRDFFLPKGGKVSKVE